MADGTVSRASAGSILGPVSTLIGAGVGAAVGPHIDQKAGEYMYEKISDDRSA